MVSLNSYLILHSLPANAAGRASGAPKKGSFWPPEADLGVHSDGKQLLSQVVAHLGPGLNDANRLILRPQLIKDT